MARCYYFLMSCAGFVLAGGDSTRMGRDKALLPFGSGSLIETVASRIATVTSQVAILGDPVKYAQLAYPVYPDLVPGCGPISGLHTALSLHLADWNLLVACDMPRLTAPILYALLEQAESILEPQFVCVIPRTENGELQPLCAAYHSSCLPRVERALREKKFKMKVLLSELNIVSPDGWPAAAFTNVNTPEEWLDLNRDAGQ